jgi:DNA-binding transcriptional LysR family regulator
MDLRHLQHSLLLADELNFGRAALRAHLTQSAFSRSIQTAETIAGVKFFDRTRRSVKPTAVGLRIIERGRKILLDAGDLDREISFLERGIGGEVRIGAGMTFAASVLPQVAASFHRDYPGVKQVLEVSHWSTLVGDLLNERIDFFISDTSELEANPALEILHLPDQCGSLFCRAGHPLLEGPISQERLASCDFAGPPLPAPLARQLRALLGIFGATEKQLAVACNNMEILRRLVLDTDMILLNLAASMQPEISRGELVDLWPWLPPQLTQSISLQSPWGIVRLAGRTQSPAAERFIACVQDAFTDVTAQ